MNENIITYKGLVLSGGGTKGFCTLGALQYMQDNKLLDENIEYLAGTSIGSIICYFLAIGYSPIEMVVYLCSNNVFESLKLNSIGEIFTGDGIYNYSVINKHYEKMTLDKLGYIPTLKQLKDNFNKELIVSAYNISQNIPEYLSYKNYPTMSCLDAIRMSSNLPFIFNEFLYDDKEYIDGGVFDNFPISCIDIDNIKTFGIYLDTKKNNDPSSNKIIKVIDKIYNVLMIPIAENEKKRLEFYKDKVEVLKISIENFKIYTFSLQHSQKLELFSVGYNSAKEYFKKN